MRKKTANSQQLQRVQSRIRGQAALYSTFVPGGTIVFDVGANIGNRIDAFLSCGASVICLEPQPECVEHLSRVYGSNKRVTILQCAAGETDCEMPMQRSRPLDTMATMSDEFISRTDATGRFGNHKYAETLTVKVIKLESLIEKFARPSFIKIDVEGFEEHVLAGISTRPSALSFEWTPEMFEHAERCMRICETLGLKYFHISFGESMKFCHQCTISRPEMGDFLLAHATDNALFGDIYAFTSPLERVS
jgi:FkbM family methyltransferase